MRPQRPTRNGDRLAAYTATFIMSGITGWFTIDASLTHGWSPMAVVLDVMLWALVATAMVEAVLGRLFEDPMPKAVQNWPIPSATDFGDDAMRWTPAPGETEPFHLRSHP